MIEQTKLFFSTLLGEIDINIIYAISVCIAFLLIYGIILRPLLSLANGKKGKPIFDIIVIGLCLMIGFKLLFPDLFVKDGFTENDLQDYYDQGYSDGYDRGEGEGYDKGYEDGSSFDGASLPEYISFEDSPLYDENACIYTNNQLDCYVVGTAVFSTSSVLNARLIDSEDVISFNGIPIFSIEDGTTYYVYPYYELLYQVLGAYDVYTFDADFFFLSV